MGSDGSAQTNVTDPGSGAMPAWSPNGQKMAFERAGNLWVMNANGSVATQLTFFNDCCTRVLDPAWSPDGAKIVYARTEPVFDDDLQQIVTGPTNLYVVDANGDNATRLTNTAVDELDPAWSPDNLEILFDTPAGLEIMNADGSGRTSLGVTGETPSWSPDGLKVAFTRNGDIWKMNPNGSGQSQLTTDPGDDRWPAWSPDNGAIAFASDRDGGYEIFTMDASGAGQAALTTDFLLSPPAESIDPDWQPAGGLDPYPRTASATPTRVPLVPAFTECTAPNSQHVSPLALPSCSPVVEESQVLTTSTVGRGSGFARLQAIIGNLSTPGDEADIRIFSNLSDVKCAQSSAACPGGAGSDFSGNILLRTAIRITDSANGFGAVPATVTDATLDAPAACTATANSASGSNCAVDTTADTLIPNYVKENKKTVVRALAITVRDPGPNGSGFGAGCPPTCGDGDETTYMREGVVTP
jgi:hypothetical protein